jgi:hypothetical protein
MGSAQAPRGLHRRKTDDFEGAAVSERRAESFICRAEVSLRRRAGLNGAHRVIQRARRYQTGAPFQIIAPRR